MIFYVQKKLPAMLPKVSKRVQANQPKKTKMKPMTKKATMIVKQQNFCRKKMNKNRARKKTTKKLNGNDFKEKVWSLRLN